MSLNALRSAHQYIAEQAGARWSQPRLGLRTSYDPNTGAVKVMLQPENIETGFIPLMPLWQGDGWGMFAPPPSGAQVLVVFQEGSLDHGMCLGALPSLVDRPLAVPDGELWLQHISGAGFKLTNDGAATYLGSAGQSLTLGSDGSAVLDNGAGATLTLAGGVATLLGADQVNLGSDSPTQPVMLANGMPATKVFAV